jgi:hypothetical protein
MYINILFIVFIILLFFFISNEKKIDEVISKKYVKYVLLLCIVYFIYQNYNFGILVLAILIFVLLNTNLKNKVMNNKYLETFGQYKNFIYETFSSDILDTYDVKPYKPLNIKETEEEIVNVSNNSNINQTEPFKNEVLKLKDLYDNVKMEIEKLRK